MAEALDEMWPWKPWGKEWSKILPLICKVGPLLVICRVNWGPYKWLTIDGLGPRCRDCISFRSDMLVLGDAFVFVMSRLEGRIKDRLAYKPLELMHS